MRARLQSFTRMQPLSCTTLLLSTHKPCPWSRKARVIPDNSWGTWSRTSFQQLGSVLKRLHGTTDLIRLPRTWLTPPCSLQHVFFDSKERERANHQTVPNWYQKSHCYSSKIQMPSYIFYHRIHCLLLLGSYFMFHRHTGSSFWVSLLIIFKNKPTKNKVLFIVWFLLSALETVLHSNFKSQRLNAQWQMGWAFPLSLIIVQGASAVPASTTGDMWQYSSLSAALLLPFMPAWHTTHQMTLLLLTPAPMDSGKVRNNRRNCSRSKIQKESIRWAQHLEKLLLK